MHHLAHIRIQNFRSCRDVALSLGDCTPIVGYNNAGKSNLLDALAWFVAPAPLHETDFYSAEKAVTVEGMLTGLDGDHLARLATKHRTKIQPYILEGKLQVRRTQLDPGAKKGDIAFEVRDPAVADEAEGAWKPNPSGIDNALKALFPEPITIGAMEDSAEDATKAKNTSTIGKLLAEFTGPAEANHGEELQQILAPLSEKLTADGADRAEELTRFDEQATAALRPFFPGIRLHLDIPVPTVRDLFSKGTVKVSEQGRDAIRDFTALGHCAQRSIQMALIRYLAEKRAVQTDTAQRRLLLIEEPELFLHPQAIERIRTALDSLARHGYQVVFATHSPVMVEPNAVARTRIIRKASESAETRIMPTAEEVLAARNPEEDKRLVTLFALENASHWLFSDRVLLAEGPTERHLLPAIYQAVTGRNPADDGLAILDVAGADNVPEALAVMAEVGIEASGLVDLDFIVNKGMKSKLLTDGDADLLEYRRQMQARDGRNPADARKAETIRDWAATAEAAPVASALFEKLKDQGIWLWTGGDIEHHLGLTESNKGLITWSRFRKQLEQEPYQEVIADPASIEGLVHWLAPTPLARP